MGFGLFEGVLIRRCKRRYDASTLSKRDHIWLVSRARLSRDLGQWLRTARISPGLHSSSATSPAAARREDCGHRLRNASRFWAAGCATGITLSVRQLREDLAGSLGAV